MSWGYQPRSVGTEWNPATKNLVRGAWPVCGEADHGLVAGIEAGRTVLFDDPLFGLFAFGGKATRGEKTISVIPHDGARQRFSAVIGAKRVHLSLDRDGFAKDQPLEMSTELDTLNFSLENRGTDAHIATLRIEGLPQGSYTLAVNRDIEPPSLVAEGGVLVVPVKMAAGSTTLATVQPIGKGKALRP
jgi:hypothetical protein